MPRPAVLLVLLAACQPEPAPGGDPPITGETGGGGDTEDSAPPDTAPPDDTDPPEDTDDPPEDTAPPEDTGEPVDPDLWRSALYPAGWTPGFAVGDHFLHDFSYAGYHNGEDPLPSKIPGDIYDVVSGYGADSTGTVDSTAAIQAAIDAAEAAGGGMVLLPAGLYRLDGLLSITASGVVLSGEGIGKTTLIFTKGTSMTDVHHITFQGSLEEEADRPLAEDGAALSRVVRLEDAGGLAVGDDLYVGWTITDEFVAEHAMDGTWYSFNGQWKPFFRVSVAAVDTSTSPHTVEVDVPLRYAAQVRDGASVRRVSGYLSECGVQDLSISTAVAWADAWSNDRSHAIGMVGVEDCWVRGVASAASPLVSDGRGDHLQSGGVIVQQSKRVTVADATMQEAQNRGDGGNGYLFEITRSNEVLIRDSVARAGRHNFIQNWDFGTSGCVFLRTVSEGGASVYSADVEWLTWTSYSEFHHSLAMASLIDASEVGDGWQALNRQDYSSGAGHAATEVVFWNLSGAGSLTSTQYGYGYVIGTTDVSVDVAVWGVLGSEGTAPEDYTEGLGLGADLEPASLYEDQLAGRLARGEALWSP